MMKLPAELQQALCLPAELTINHVLRYDPVASKALARQQGRLLALEILGVSTLYVRVLDGSLGLSLSNDAEPDAILSGTASDFLALASAQDKASTLINSHIDMDGDSEFAIALTRIAQNLDIDWEALISPVTGGLIAHQIGQGLRGLFKWGKSTAPVYRSAIKDYLEDEAGLVTPEPLLSQFADEVDELKLAADRLAARLERLVQAQAAASESTTPSPKEE